MFANRRAFGISNFILLFLFLLVIIPLAALTLLFGMIVGASIAIYRRLTVKPVVKSGPD